MDASTRSVVESNRASWNVIAPRRSGMAIERLRAGETGLQDFERQLAGDVSGRRVVQLACSYGDEVLSWANLGARATGVDISDVAVATARARAAEAGIDADFRRADMLDPPADLVDLEGARGEPEAPRFSTFVWPVSDVVMAFVRAGLRLEAFFESPEPGLYAGLGGSAGSLPAYYVIKATKADSFGGPVRSVSV